MSAERTCWHLKWLNEVASFHSLFKPTCVWTFYSKYTDLVPKEVMNADDPDLQRPDEEAIKEVTGNWHIIILDDFLHPY
jgi:hypothetical protein